MERKINVSLRIKPLLQSEIHNERNHLWAMLSDTAITNKRTKESYHFDKVFGDAASTEAIFDSQIREIVHAALNGINQTVFVYGQTSSGKTHTMKGYQHQRGKGAGTEDQGLIPLSVREIFEHA